MSIVVWYLGIGVVCLAVVYLADRLSRSEDDDFVESFMLATDPNSGKWWWMPLNKVVVPLLAAFVVVVAWPLLIFWKAEELIKADKAKEDGDSPTEELSVSREHLLRQLTVEEIEAAEVVEDPLKAAPRVPFGHLNPVWEAFKASITEGDELWQFVAPRRGAPGYDQMCEGYVVLRNGHIGPHFVARFVRSDVV